MSQIIQSPLAQMPVNVQNALQNTPDFNIYMKQAEEKLHQLEAVAYQLHTENERLEQQLKRAQTYQDREVLLREALRACKVPQNEIVNGVATSTATTLVTFAVEVADLILAQRPKEPTDAKSNLITAS